MCVGSVFIFPFGDTLTKLTNTLPLEKQTGQAATQALVTSCAAEGLLIKNDRDSKADVPPHRKESRVD